MLYEINASLCHYGTLVPEIRLGCISDEDSGLGVRCNILHDRLFV
jgi:hypothetical protein